MWGKQMKYIRQLLTVMQLYPNFQKIGKESRLMCLSTTVK